MKRIFVLMTVLLLSLLGVFSCKSNLPGRFESFVTAVGENYRSYSTEDWDKANARFEKLCNEYSQNRRSYNSEQKKRINKSIAKYWAIVAKSGVEDAVDTIQEITEELPDLIDGVQDFLLDLTL